MSRVVEVRLPDIGELESAKVLELLVAPGDRVGKDDSLVTLESDKASMDVPAPLAGTVKQISVAAGDKVREGSLLLTLETEQLAAGAVEEPAVPPRERPATAQLRPAGAGRRAEVVVLGGGPGGYTAAFRAADLGKQTILVERYPRLGGVCLNVGCIPSKALLHVARVMAEVGELAANGVDYGAPSVDLERLRRWKQGVVDRLTQGLSRLARQRNVEVLQGTGRFVSAHRLEVATPDGALAVDFEQAIIAAGSRGVELPGFPTDEPRIMGSSAALELADVPRRLLVVGGGIIGLEMATVYAALGSQVTVVEMLDRLLPGCDPDLVKPLRKRVEKRYEAIHLETRVSRLEPGKKGLRATFEGVGAPEPALFDRVLVAVGRQPNGDRIGAEAAGIEVTDRGFVRVDREQRTNVPHIFAIGDIAAPPLLAHKAMHEGKVAAEVAAGQRSAFDARAVPSVAYTDPEVAWVGWTEAEARAQGLDYGKGTFPWAASGRSLTLGRDEGLTKLLFDRATRQVIGAGIVGPGAGELIAEVALAIEMGCEAEDLALTIHPHPTLSETVGLAAEAFTGTLTDLYLPRK